MDGNNPDNWLIRLDDQEFICSFRFPETHLLFQKNLVRQEDRSGLFLMSEDWKSWNQTGKVVDAAAEFSLFSPVISDELMKYDRILMHGAAFRFRERGYIITAPSGVGKSRQVRTLNQLHSGLFPVICGDRPVLHFENSGCVTVNPSPWNGKEGWYGAEGAPLAALIVLKRGTRDRIRRLTKKEAVIPVFSGMIYSRKNGENIRMAAFYTDRLLRMVPVWELTNRETPGSTELLYQHVLLEGMKNGLSDSTRN